MNDDAFLQQLRAAPSAQFAASLKARLDRQPYRAQVRRGPWGHALGFALLGLATFALALIFSSELREFVRDLRTGPAVTANPPAAAVPTSLAHRPGRSRQTAAPGPLPDEELEALAPLPSEVTGTTAAVPRAADDSDVPSIAAPADGAGAGRMIWMVTAPEVFDFTWDVVTEFTRRGGGPAIRLGRVSATQAFSLFCGPGGGRDIISTTRRMRASEYQSCRRNGSGELIESKMPFAPTLMLYVYVRRGQAAPPRLREFLRAYWLALVAASQRPVPPKPAPQDLYFFDVVKPSELQP